MKITVDFSKPSKKMQHSQIIFHIELEKEDNINPSKNVKFGSNQFSFLLPKEVTLEEIHPDHLALVSVLVCHPFIGERIVFPKGVSKQFFKAHEIVTRYIVENVDETLQPWEPSRKSRPALAFSGGADSTAALALMPSNTMSVFLDRPLKFFDLYNKEAVYKACDYLIENGYEVMKVISNLEFVRDPIGFPVDVANACPAILLASHMGFDAIAFGTIMESAFGVGHKNYRNYPTGNHFSHLGGIFRAAGLPFFQVVSGVSEVGTAIINRDSSIGHIAHSCMRGKWRSPCKNCWKCFRKIFLDSVVHNKELNNKEIKKLFKIEEARRFLSEFPIKHENVLTYFTSKYIEIFNLNINDGGIMSLLTKRVRGDVMDVNWMEKYFPLMFETIPEKYRVELKENLEKYLQPMDKNEENTVLNWNMSGMLDDQSYQNLHHEFCNEMLNPIDNQKNMKKFWLRRYFQKR